MKLIPTLTGFATTARIRFFHLCNTDLIPSLLSNSEKSHSVPFFNPPVRTTRRKKSFLTGSEDPSLPTLVVITADTHSFCTGFIYTHNGRWCPPINLLLLFNHFPKLHSKKCETKEDKETLHDTHFTFTTCFSLARPLSPFLGACQMGFMYLIYLGEWATVETKALRHILLARALFKKKKKNRHACSLQAHIRI